MEREKTAHGAGKKQVVKDKKGKGRKRWDMLGILPLLP